MNGTKAKALRRATGFDPNAEPTYRATPTRAYVVQSFVVVGSGDHDLMYLAIQP